MGAVVGVEEVGSGGRGAGKGIISRLYYFRPFIMCLCIIYIMGDTCVLEILNVGRQVWEAPLLSPFTSPGIIDFRAGRNRHGSQE